MGEFVTVAMEDGPSKVLTWSDEGGRPRVVGRAAGLGPEHDGLDLWGFEVPTSLGARNAFNRGNHPVVDADGGPLWPGCRAAYRLPSYHLSGAGVVHRLDLYGAAAITGDAPKPFRGRNGELLAEHRDFQAAFTEFHRDGELEGFRQMAGTLGDPWEHGSVETFLRVEDDPRGVCVRLAPTASRGPGR